jgi:hypothetical protein
MTTQPVTATAPPGVPRSAFVDSFESQPGTPGSRTGHVFPSINRIRKNLGGEGAGPLKKLMVANRGVSVRQASRQRRQRAASMARRARPGRGSSQHQV